MDGWRQDLSTLGLIVGAVLTLGGWLLAFTDVGAALMFTGWAVALASAALYPTRRRFMAVAIILALALWYVALLLAAIFVVYELTWARRTSTEH